jgi:cytochrome P450
MAQKLPPGPRYPSLIQGIGLWSRPLAYLEKLRATYGKRFTARFPFTIPFVAITEPEQIKEVYTAPPDVLKPGTGGQVLAPLVGRDSVILLDGSAHMEQRKLMLPAFHGERMERLRELMTEVTIAEIESWRAERIELHPRFQELTLEIILRAVFGLDPGPRLDAIRRSLSALLAYGDSPMTLLPPPDSDEKMEKNIQLASKVGPLKGFADRRDEVDALLAEQIAERRAAAEDDRDDVLAMLLDARHEDGSEMSAQELRDELMTLLIAGHETTASTLAWTFDRLAHEPRVVHELTAEIEHENDGPYLTATLQESLRSRPVLPNTLPRYVEQPIRVGGWDYEPGCCLVANAYLVHHDPDLYPEPYTFRPERFLDEKPGTYTWIPFGGGRRRCLGASFAMLEMEIVLAEVLRRFDVRPARDVPETARRRNITVYPKHGASVQLAVRERERVAA